MPCYTESLKRNLMKSSAENVSSLFSYNTSNFTTELHLNKILHQSDDFKWLIIITWKIVFKEIEKNKFKKK